MSDDAPESQDPGQGAESRPRTDGPSQETAVKASDTPSGDADASAGESDDAGREQSLTDVSTTAKDVQENSSVANSDQDLPLIWKNPETGEIDIVKDSKGGHDLLLNAQDDSKEEKQHDHIGFDEQGKLVFIKGRSVQSTDAYEVDGEDSETRRSDSELR
jgi:hypothetical protein